MNEKYKIIINREKSFVGCLVGFKIYVDNNYVGKVKNGKTLIIEVTPGEHVLSLNKMNPVGINVYNDIAVDTVIFGPNNFGFNNIRINGEEVSNTNTIDYSKRYAVEANANLIFSFVIPFIYFIFDKSSYIHIWLFSMFIGYGIINIFGLKKIKNTNRKVYTSSLIKNIIAIIIAIVFVILAICKYAGI